MIPCTCVCVCGYTLKCFCVCAMFQFDDESDRDESTIQWTECTSCALTRSQSKLYDLKTHSRTEAMKLIHFRWQNNFYIRNFMYFFFLLSRFNGIFGLRLFHFRFSRLAVAEISVAMSAYRLWCYRFFFTFEIDFRRGRGKHSIFMR